eukprot:11197574-Lingulodinium_polyedra.AAC.1
MQSQLAELVEFRQATSGARRLVHHGVLCLEGSEFIVPDDCRRPEDRWDRAGCHVYVAHSMVARGDECSRRP